LSGSGIRREIAQEILSCFFGALTWSLIPWLADICLLDRRVGIGAALAGVVLTINRWAETKGSSEAAMAGLAGLLVFVLFMKCWYSRNFSMRNAVSAGLLSGIAMLVSASLGSIVFGLLIASYLLFRRPVGLKYLRFGLVTIAVTFATLLPWALRNYFVLGGLVWTRSNFPLELMVSNNDYALPTLDENQVAGYQYHPFMSPEQRAAVKSMGDLAYQRKVKGEAFHWIASHPRRFASLTLQRAFLFWFPQMKRPIQTLALSLLAWASIPGLVFLLKRREPIGYGLLTIFLTYPCVYYIVQSHPRYVYPIQWTLYLLASESIMLAYLSWKGIQPATSGRELIPESR